MWESQLPGMESCETSCGFPLLCALCILQVARFGPVYHEKLSVGCFHQAAQLWCGGVANNRPFTETERGNAWFFPCFFHLCQVSDRGVTEVWLSFKWNSCRFAGLAQWQNNRCFQALVKMNFLGSLDTPLKFKSSPLWMIDKNHTFSLNSLQSSPATVSFSRAPEISTWAYGSPRFSVPIRTWDDQARIASKRAEHIAKILGQFARKC